MSGSAEPVGIRLQLRWADTDAYGHVNNVSWVRYLEEARIRLFGLPDQPATAAAGHTPIFAVFGTGCFTITAAQQLEYVRELPYHGQEIWIEGWVSRLGSSSLDLSFRVRDEPGGEVYLVAETTQTLRSVATRRARPFEEPELRVLRRHLGPPPEFRRSGAAQAKE